MLAALFVQLLVFDHLPIFGVEIRAYLLFMFIAYLRVRDLSYLIYVFFLSFTIDLYRESGGANTIASLFFVAIRIPILTLTLKKTYVDIKQYQFKNIMKRHQVVFYVFLMVFVHQAIFYNLYYLGTDVDLWSKVLLGTAVTSLFVLMYGLLLRKVFR